MCGTRRGGVLFLCLTRISGARGAGRAVWSHQVSLDFAQLVNRLVLHRLTNSLV